jgi:hypothetical protein
VPTFLSREYGGFWAFFDFLKRKMCRFGTFANLILRMWENFRQGADQGPSGLERDGVPSFEPLQPPPWI